MSAIRRQSAVSRGAAERAESRRCRSTSSRYVDSERDEASRQGTELRNGHINRKISYQDWSDEESGAYYYEDEESSVVESFDATKESLKNENCRDTGSRGKFAQNHVIDFGAASKPNRYDSRRNNHYYNKSSKPFASGDNKQSSSKDFQDSKPATESNTDVTRSRSVSSDSSSSSDHESSHRHRSRDQSCDGAYTEEGSKEIITDASLMNTTALSSPSPNVSAIDGRNDNSSTPDQTKTSVPKTKVSILEQIMQSRTTHRAKGKPRSRQHTENTHPSNGYSRTSASYNSNQGGRGGNPRRLQKREPLDTRLKHSPYCEPMPQLFIVYTPVAQGASHRRDEVLLRDRTNIQRGKASFPEAGAPPTKRRAKTASLPSRGRTGFPAVRDGGTMGSYGGQPRYQPRPHTQQSTRANKYR